MPRNRQKRGEVAAVSITSSSWQAQPGALDQFDIGKIRTELTEAIVHTKQVQWAALVLDISMNDDTEKAFDVAWQFQFYGFAKVIDRHTFSKSLRRVFHSGMKVVRPVVVKPCDGTARAFSYAFKPESVRRIAYWGDGRTHTGEPRKCWRTRKVSLKAREEIELRTLP